MAKSRSGLRIFFVSFLISFTVLGGIFLLFLMYRETGLVSQPNSDVPYLSDYVPDRSQNLSLFVLGCEQAESLPDLAQLYYYDAPEGILYVIGMPAVTVCSVRGKSDTIQGHYDYEGLRGGVNALNALLDMECDRYIRMQGAGISTMVDFFGGVPYLLEEEKNIGEQTFLPGEQLLDGRRVTALLFERDNAQGIDHEAQTELAAALLKNGMQSRLVDRYERMTSAVFYNCETNLSQYDFSVRQTGFSNWLRDKGLTVKSILLTGSYTSDYSEFYPAEESVNEIKTLLHGQEPESSE